MHHRDFAWPSTFALFLACLLLAPAHAMASARNGMMLLPEPLHLGTAALSRYPGQLAPHRGELFALGLQGSGPVPPTAGAIAHHGPFAGALLVGRPQSGFFPASIERVVGGGAGWAAGAWSAGLTLLANQRDSEGSDVLEEGGATTDADRDSYFRSVVELTLGAGVALHGHRIDAAARTSWHEDKESFVSDPAGPYYQSRQLRDRMVDAWTLSLRHRFPLPGGGSGQLDAGIALGDQRYEETVILESSLDRLVESFETGAELVDDHLGLLLVNSPEPANATAGVHALAWRGDELVARGSLGSTNTENREYRRATVGAFGRRQVARGLRATAAVAVERRVEERARVIRDTNTGDSRASSNRTESIGSYWAWGLEYEWRGIELAGLLRHTLRLDEPLLLLDVHIPFSLDRD